MSNTDLVLRRLEREDARVMAEAKTLARSKVVPEAFQGQPEKTAVVIAAGRRIGLGPLESCRMFYVPKDGQLGKMTQLQVALAAQHDIDVAIYEPETDENQAVAWLHERGKECKRCDSTGWLEMPDGNDKLCPRCVRRFKFTMKDADKAGLTREQSRSGNKKWNWEGWATRMLRYRVSGVIGENAGHVLLGFNALLGVTAGATLDEPPDDDEIAEAEIVDENTNEGGDGITVPVPPAPEETDGQGAAETSGRARPTTGPPLVTSSWLQRFAIQSANVPVPEGFTVRQVRHKIAERAVGRHLESAKELRASEGPAVMKLLGRVLRGELEVVHLGDELQLEEVAA